MDRSQLSAFPHRRDAPVPDGFLQGAPLSWRTTVNWNCLEKTTVIMKYVFLTALGVRLQSQKEQLGLWYHLWRPVQGRRQQRVRPAFSGCVFQVIACCFCDSKMPLVSWFWGQECTKSCFQPLLFHKFMFLPIQDCLGTCVGILANYCLLLFQHAPATCTLGPGSGRTFFSVSFLLMG